MVNLDLAVFGFGTAFDRTAERIGHELTAVADILRAIANRNNDLQSAVFDGGRRIAPLSAPFIRPLPKPHSGFGGCCAACKAQHCCALQ